MVNCSRGMVTQFCLEGTFTSQVLLEWLWGEMGKRRRCKLAQAKRPCADVMSSTCAISKQCDVRQVP